MISIAICDDEAASRRQLHQYCQRYKEETGLDVRIIVFESAASLLEQWSDQIDIAILDIQMDGINGMQAAYKLRQQDSAVDIIFFTNMSSYAIEGYQVQASQFIIKPASYTKVKSALEHSVAKIERLRNNMISLHVGSQWIRIPAHKVIYVESARNKIIVHTQEERYDVYTTMQEMEKKLSADNYFRCHSGFLINLLAVVKMNGTTAIMSNGDEVLISKYRKKEFMEKFTNVLGDTLL